MNRGGMPLQFRSISQQSEWDTGGFRLHAQWSPTGANLGSCLTCKKQSGRLMLLVPGEVVSALIGKSGSVIKDHDATLHTQTALCAVAQRALVPTC
eukprot:4900080-Amphidinium_carterae.1